VEKAIESVKKGVTAGMLHFHKNFSRQLQLRLDEGKDASNTTIEESELGVHLDMSSMLTHDYLQLHRVTSERIIRMFVTCCRKILGCM
jgi:hypothetical protein